MEPVDPEPLTAKPAHFQGQTNPRSKHTSPFFQISCAIVHGFLTSVTTLAMEPVGPKDQISPFSRSNEPRKFRRQKCRNISWAFVNTLAMEPRRPNRPILKVKRSPEQAYPHLTDFHLL
ncbi:hypothetical protein H5410_026439 [Solanum commersonii]|uniref:Uncharacterized protein n=1 Tax=Solanum commersonii TaxID=4109 RepID=A0A9J5YW54_SOLCO|nr:hypothetical protein H5410_026439 [Solanum commersonii]